VETPDRDRCKMFQHTLQSHDVTSTLRMEKGTDINAACGQLRLQHESHEVSRPSRFVCLRSHALDAVWFFVRGFEPSKVTTVVREGLPRGANDELMRLQANLDEERLQWYYAFREVEEADDRAWEMAVRKADSEIAAKSNALANVKARLDRLQTFQAQ
jgi:hypothetical protein